MKQLYPFFCICACLLFLIRPERIQAQCSCPGGDPIDSVVHTQTLAPTADFLTTIDFPKFNPSIGTLSCLNISGTIVTVASLGIRNLDSSQRIYRFRYTQDITLNGPAGIFTNASVNKFYGPATLDKYNTGVDSVLWGPDTTFNYHVLSVSSGGSAAFLGGSGTVSFDFTNTGSTTLLQGSNNYRATVTTFALGDFRLVYYWCPNSVLAANPIRFSAVRNQENVLLQWSTDFEVRNNRYQVEFSRNGINFSALGTTQATVNGKASYSYRFVPEAGEKGKLYFRIRQTDARGKEKLTAIKSISFADNSVIGTTVYPNPVVREMNIRFESLQTGQLNIDLLNSSGQVLEHSARQVSRAHVLTLNLSRTYQKGIYWLRIRNSQSGEQSVTRLSLQ
jgi:hypothetical protein